MTEVSDNGSIKSKVTTKTNKEEEKDDEQYSDTSPCSDFSFELTTKEMEEVKREYESEVKN